jgi:hypothetical protein
LRAGITGHRKLDQPAAWDWVRAELRAALRKMPPPLTGITSLAAGADQLFAEMVLELGGAIEAVIPFEAYEETFDSPADLDAYRRLKSRAARREVLHAPEGREQAYLAAGERVVELSELLVAVWDGKPARGTGGTAEIVRHALATHRPVLHFNPVSREILRQGW